MKEMTQNLIAQATAVVSDFNSAKAVKSGSLDVFSTPMMIALMEEATCKAAAPLLDEGETTVGTSICISHDKASAIGETITATAVLEEADGRRLVFTVSAVDSKGDVIGSGKIDRFVVLSDKFMRRVNGQ